MAEETPPPPDTPARCNPPPPPPPLCYAPAPPETGGSVPPTPGGSTRHDDRGTRPLSLRFMVVLGIALGIAFYAFLFVLSLLQYGGYEYMGVQNAEIQDRIVAMFLDTVILQEIKILLIYAGFGLLIGLPAGLWLFLVSRAFRPRMSRRLATLALLVTLAAAHTLFLWYGMAVHPRLFIDQFYNASALPFLFQYIGSELLTPWLLKAVGSLWFLSFPALSFLALRRESRLPTVALSVVALFLVAWQWTSLPDSLRYRLHGSSGSERPNVLILALDSLRPDYMEGAAGDGLARLRRESVSFSGATSPFPRTFPAWVSMLTGQEPAQHGIRHMFPTPALLSRPRVSLADTLAEAGWETAVFSDFAGDIFGRIDLGFQHVEVPEFSLRSNVRLGVWKMHVHLIPYLAASGLLDRHESP
ncbi:MAG: hypothetical protein FJ109_19590, partial [Deltaproteobacteria bacterium]|nr:hypothetical protein [Deltaproteobacteria bacterium]